MNNSIGRAGELLTVLQSALAYIEKHWEQSDSLHQISVIVHPNGYVEIRATQTLEECVAPLSRALGVALGTLSFQEKNVSKQIPESLKKVLGVG